MTRRKRRLHAGVAPGLARQPARAALVLARAGARSSSSSRCPPSTATSSVRASSRCSKATRPPSTAGRSCSRSPRSFRMASIHFGAIMWTKAWVHMQTFLRANLLTAQVASGGPQAGQPVGSAGEALTHFRDDTEDVAQLVDGMVDVRAGSSSRSPPGSSSAPPTPPAPPCCSLPLVGVVLVTRALDSRIKEYRAADREATGEVTGLVGDLMAAATTIKVYDSSGPMLDRLRRLVDRRRDTAVRDHVLDESVQAFSRGAADVGLGLVLLVSAGALASGAFDVGTHGVVRVVPGLAQLHAADGRARAGPPQAGGGGVRPDAPARRRPGRDQHVRPRRLPLEARQRGGRPADDRPDRVPLERLDVVGLSAWYPGGVGVHDVTLHDGARRLRRPHRSRRLRQEHAAAGAARARVAGRHRRRGALERSPRSRIGRPSSYRRTPRSCPRCRSSCPIRCATTSGSARSPPTTWPERWRWPPSTTTSPRCPAGPTR